MVVLVSTIVTVASRRRIVAITIIVISLISSFSSFQFLLFFCKLLLHTFKLLQKKLAVTDSLPKLEVLLEYLRETNLFSFFFRKLFFLADRNLNVELMTLSDCPWLQLRQINFFCENVDMIQIGQWITETTKIVRQEEIQNFAAF